MPNMTTCQIQRCAVLIKADKDCGTHTCSIVFENKSVSFYFTNNSLKTNQSNGLLLYNLVVLNLLSPYILQQFFFFLGSEWAEGKE